MDYWASTPISLVWHLRNNIDWHVYTLTYILFMAPEIYDRYMVTVIQPMTLLSYTIQESIPTANLFWQDTILHHSKYMYLWTTYFLLRICWIFKHDYSELHWWATKGQHSTVFTISTCISLLAAWIALTAYPMLFKQDRQPRHIRQSMNTA